MQEVFRNAVYHTEPTVLLRHLKPLALGHCFILLAADSPYILGTIPNLMDLALAAGVCSRTFEDAGEWIKSPGIKKDCTTWGKRCRGMNFAAESRKLSDYLRDFSAMPSRFLPKTAKPCLHPWPLFLVAELLQLNIGESRAWNMPLPMAISITSAYGETQGDKSLESEDDRRMIDELKARQEKGAA